MALPPMFVPTRTMYTAHDINKHMTGVVHANYMLGTKNKYNFLMGVKQLVEGLERSEKSAWEGFNSSVARKLAQV